MTKQDTRMTEANAIVQRAVDGLIAEGREIGVQVAAYVNEKPAIQVNAGKTAEDGGAPVTSDTLFSIFSVIKGITAFTAHIQAERGLLDYDAPIARYWPEFGVNGKEHITMTDVLTHRAGIPQMPDGVTPELMCDWDWMTKGIAALKPVLEPKVKSSYLAMTFGWIVGEVVRRTDPKHRPIGQFMQEEICRPLKMDNVYLSLPDAAIPRVAKLSYVPDPLPPEGSLTRAAMPPQVGLVPAVFERPDVRRADVPAVGGVASAHSLVRFFAMLANDGELDGVRLLSADRVRSFLTPRTNAGEMEPVLGKPWRLSNAGFFLAFNKPAVGTSPNVLFCMGQGGSLAWTDMKRRYAVAITHNKMLNARSPETDPIVVIAQAVRQALGIPEE